MLAIIFIQSVQGNNWCIETTAASRQRKDIYVAAVFYRCMFSRFLWTTDSGVIIISRKTASTMIPGIENVFMTNLCICHSWVAFRRWCFVRYFLRGGSFKKSKGSWEDCFKKGFSIMRGASWVPLHPTLCM